MKRQADASVVKVYRRRKRRTYYRFRGKGGRGGGGRERRTGGEGKGGKGREEGGGEGKERIESVVRSNKTKSGENRNIIKITK